MEFLLVRLEALPSWGMKSSVMRSCVFVHIGLAKKAQRREEKLEGIFKRGGRGGNKGYHDLLFFPPSHVPF